MKVQVLMVGRVTNNHPKEATFHDQEAGKKEGERERERKAGRQASNYHSRMTQNHLLGPHKTFHPLSA